MPASYVATLAKYYPSRLIECKGDGYDYDLLTALDGLPLPTKATLDPQRLALGRENKWLDVRNERDRRKFNGVKVGGSWFHSDDTSRIQQIGLMLMGASMPSGILWKTMTDTFVTMTPTLAQQIFQATAAQDLAIFAAAERHRALIYQSEHPSAYDYSTGWPPTFEG